MDDADRFDGKSSCGIAFMAKASAPGRAKTRLVPPLTFEEAAVLNTAFLQDVADNVLLAAATPRHRIAGYAAFGPPGSEDFFRRTLPRGIGLIEAWRPNFGDCLLHTHRARFSPADMRPPWCSIPTARRCRRRSWSRPPRYWRGRATVPCSVRRATAAIICSASRPRIAICSRTSPGAPSSVAEQTLERAREIGLDVHRCRSGTMSTMSTVCAGCTPNLRGTGHGPKRGSPTALAARIAPFTRRR